MPQHNSKIIDALTEISDAKGSNKKQAALRKYESPALIKILKYALDPEVVFDLPPGMPPYTQEDGNLDHNLTNRNTLRQFDYWKIAVPLSQAKRQENFINTLSVLTPVDAELVVSMVAKSLPYDISLKDCKAVWPQYF